MQDKPKTRLTHFQTDEMMSPALTKWLLKYLWALWRDLDFFRASSEGFCGFNPIGLHLDSMASFLCNLALSFFIELGVFHSGSLQLSFTYYLKKQQKAVFLLKMFTL